MKRHNVTPRAKNAPAPPFRHLLACDSELVHAVWGPSGKNNITRGLSIKEELEIRRRIQTNVSSVDSDPEKGRHMMKHRKWKKDCGECFR